jgi:hypothetical protein
MAPQQAVVFIRNVEVIGIYPEVNGVPHDNEQAAVDDEHVVQTRYEVEPSPHGR